MTGFFFVMTFTEFESTLRNAAAPTGLSAILTALWYDGKDDWEGSHDIAQDIHSQDGSWVHAYLHRKEGDDSNAAYWYNKAGKPFQTVSLKEEWKQMVTEFLARSA
jgi:hypothetical protein